MVFRNVDKINKIAIQNCSNIFSLLHSSSSAKLLKFVCQIKQQALYEKPYFPFPNVLKRLFFQKNRTGIWFSLYHQERWYFFFPENMILFFRRKIKDDLSQKNAWKYDIFFKCSGKMVFPKKLHWNIIFFTSWGNMAFFFPKIWYFFRDRKWKMVFLKK